MAADKGVDQSMMGSPVMLFDVLVDFTQEEGREGDVWRGSVRDEACVEAGASPWIMWNVFSSVGFFGSKGV